MRLSNIKIDYSAPIEFGTGWSCCIGKETHVIVFDNGHRWAVCTGCANQYTGPVYSLAIFDPEHFVFSYQYLTTRQGDGFSFTYNADGFAISSTWDKN